MGCELNGGKGHTSSSDGFVLLYDGLCGLCNSTVRWIIRHDRNGTMQFAPLQGDFGRSVLERHPSLGSIDSLILVHRTSDGNETLFIRSDGVLKTAGYLGGLWRVFRIAVIIPRRLRDGAYDLLARHRFRFFRRYASCPLPSPSERNRFLV